MKRTWFYLCEASALGPLACVKDALDRGRGYSIRFIFEYQSPGQLKECWPTDEGRTLLSQTSQVFIAVNDNETACYVSARLGAATVWAEDEGTNSGESRNTGVRYESGSSGLSSGTSVSWRQTKRELLTPAEVCSLDPRTAIVFAPRVPPIWTSLVMDYEEPELWRGPGLWVRTKTKAKVLAGTMLVLVASAVFIAAACALSFERLSHPFYATGRR